MPVEGLCHPPLVQTLVRDVNGVDSGRMRLGFFG